MPELLAIDGGTPVRTAPLPAWPVFAETTALEVAQKVRTGRVNYWTGGDSRLLEQRYAETLGRNHAVAVANGTVAIELALRAFGVGAGDEVVVPARTFIATAGAVVAAGATPVVADVDPDSGNLTARTVEAVLSPATRAVIAVHVGGWPVEMDPLLELARSRSLLLFEDAAQAHGARYRDRPVGALGSDAATFSFCNDKIISCGEGGILVLDDEDAFRRAWSFRDHGKSFDGVHEALNSTDSSAYRWLVESFGTNWRLAELCAPLALAGLASLPEYHRVRTRNAVRLAHALGGLESLRVPLPPEHMAHAYYRLYGFVRPERLAEGWDRDRITTAIAAEGIPCGYGTCAEIYREQAFAVAGVAPAGRLPFAAELHDTSLAFLVHPTLSDADIDDTAAAVTRVMEAATR